MTLSQQMAGSKVGYILDRKVFDRELVWQAAMAGADVFVKTRAVAPILDDGRVRGATVAFCGEERKVAADVVIAADGIESKFARWCGLDTTVPMRELMSCAQYVLTDIDIDPHVTVFYFGNRIAPEGYTWIFPKGERTANVGIGISGSKSRDGHRARQLLDRFIADIFPRGKMIECIVGGVSVCRPLPCTVADGLEVVGDAARLSDPITGGGIANAMITGRMAAEVAAEAIGKGDVTAGSLMRYDRAWREGKLGETLERNYRIKEAVIRLDDETLNALVQSASRINLKEFSVLSLVKELITRNPKLLLELKSLYSALK
jgi:digeranylgeranylglycerophospholipid reductase